MTSPWWAPATTLLAIIGMWACILACGWFYGWQAGALALLAAQLMRLEVNAAQKMRGN